jgi:glycine cleavage system aminomethyltransferase T
LTPQNAPPSFRLVAEAEGKTTPLIEEHRRAGAKIIPFGGWLMPVQYTSINDEHHAVRKNVGVFDISHMGQLVASGARAGEWLNRMLTNNVDKLEVRGGHGVCVDRPARFVPALVEACPEVSGRSASTRRPGTATR